MDITLEQKIAVLRDTLPTLTALSDEQLKTHIESGTVADTVKSIIALELKPTLLKEGKDGAFGEFGTALRKAAKEFDPEVNTDADEWRDTPTKVLKRIVEIAKQKPIPPANIDAIKSELKARLKEQYKPLEEELIGYKAKVQEFERVQRNAARENILQGSSEKLNVLKDSPRYKHYLKLAASELERYEFEPLEGVGTVLKDKDGNFLKVENKLQTIESVLRPIAEELDIVKRSDTATPPPIVTPVSVTTPEAKHPNDYAKL